MRLWLICLTLLILVAWPACAQVPEHRGLWIGSANFDTPAKADEIVARAARANLNVLYPLVWYNGGQAWYNSELSPKAATVAPDFDPLGYLLKIAHARGMEVHAWFVAGSYGYIKEGEGVFKQHPDWALQTGRPSLQKWYDLGRPEVRKFETEVMLDCLRHYPVDGLHFDYIRYDGQDYCYCNSCQQEFSARYGFPALPSAALLPAALSLSANPLTGPTTAQVLATFDDGEPALTLNKLGQGETVLLNWTAQRTGSPAVSDFVSRMLTRFGVKKDNLFQLSTTQTAAKYRPEAQQQALDWLRGLGHKPRLLDETKLDQVPPGGTVVLACQYYLDEKTTLWLENFVTAGGHCLVLDGPVFAIAQPSLQRVIGLSRAGRYFHAMRVISPVPGQDILPSGPALDLQQERQRAAKWVEYRQWTVTELVRSVRQASRQIKPQVKLSAAVFQSRAAAASVCQDWYTWLQDGLVDYVVPMAYVMENSKLEELLKEWQAADPKLQRIIPGLSVYELRDGKATSRSAELVLSQEQLCRSYGAQGTVYFSFANLSEDLATALGAGPYSKPTPIYYPKPYR